MNKQMIARVILFFGILLSLEQSVVHCFNISPGRVEVTVDPSGTYEGSIVVTNNENKAIAVKVRADDWRAAVEGAGDPAADISFEWLKLGPKEFELEEGQVKEVRYKITVPEEKRGELNAMVFIEGKPKVAADGAIGINTSVGIPIYAAIKDTEVFEAEVEGVRIMKGAPLEMAVTIKNSGNVHIRPEGAIIIRDSNMAKVAEAPLNQYNYPVLPLTSRALEIRTQDKLGKGQHVANVKMKYAGKEDNKKFVIKID